MAKRSYVYVIRYELRFEDGSQEDFRGIYRVYSSLRKAIDLLKLYEDMHTNEFKSFGYDVENDSTHWVDFRYDDYYSSLVIKNGVKLTTYTISREILF